MALISSLRDASNVAVSQGELFVVDHHRCSGVLLEVLYEIPGAHLDPGADADRRRPENCLGGGLGPEAGFGSLAIRDI